MPSFRITMAVGALTEGVTADSVLPAAAAAADAVTIVEAAQIGVVRGSARIIVRFTAENDSEAVGVAEHVVRSTRRLADVPSSLITRRVQGRWYPVSPGTV